MSAITLQQRHEHHYTHGDMDENEGKKVQNEGVSLFLVDRTDSNGHCQD